jgi:5'-methylthioadenosine phosphorylase
MLGIIGGTAIMHTGLTDLTKQIVHTPYGSSEVMCSDTVVLLQRHQFHTPPHKINVRAHLCAFAILGVDAIICIGSTGSLHADLPPGSIVIPTDYFCALRNVTIYNSSITHIPAQISPELAQKLSDLFPTARYGGCYVQTEGPRFETRHEVKYLAQCGDIIGMTIAHEIMIANELEIPCAVLCFVDNYANGVENTTVSYDEVISSSKRTQERTDSMIKSLIVHCAL